MSATIYVGRHFEVRDHAQATKYVFNGATRVAEITGSLSANSRIQWLRLYPGWNLCSAAVSGSFPASGAEAISTAYQWNAGTHGYSQVALGQSLAAGTVLWLKARTNAVLSILGTYTDPAAQGVQAGGDYLAGTGLEAWSPVLPKSTSAWTFNAETAQWSDHLSGPLAGVSDPPPFVSPGDAVFVQAAAPVSLEPPDPALRIRYYHQDHLGSSSVISDTKGALVEESAFYPFGLPRHENHPRRVYDPYQFTQKERDQESCLHYFEARFLVAGLGRFTAVDPLAPDIKPAWLANPQRLNVYCYAQNQPLKYVDPTGQDRFDRLNPELQKVVSASFDEGALSCGNAKTAEGCVDRLSNREFAALTSVYDRMSERGLWQYVEHITGFSTSGELSMSFSVSDEPKFRDALAGVNRNSGPFDYGLSRHFALDAGLWNAFHKGSDSFREISDLDSLHISVYNKNNVTAHIDRYSPVALNSPYLTSMDPVRGLMHQGREAGAPFLLSAGLAKIKVPESFSLNPGLQVFPDQPDPHGDRPGIFYATFQRSF